MNSIMEGPVTEKTTSRWIVGLSSFNAGGRRLVFCAELFVPVLLLRRVEH